MKVVEIFRSIDGEGRRAGLPTVFIRLYGCNLHCSYCDTSYGCTGDDYTEMSISEIVKIVDNYKIKNITITGGEPLIHEDICNLIDTLCESEYDVNIETNGSVPINIVSFSEIRYEDTGRSYPWVTIDFKCKSSQMSNNMHLDNFMNLSSKDVLKFVVGSKDDLEQAKLVLGLINTPAQVYFSPVFGNIDPKDIVAFVLTNDLNQVHVQLQLHKYIWPVDERGV